MSAKPSSFTVDKHGLPVERDADCLHCAIATAIDRFKETHPEIENPEIITNLCELLGQVCAASAVDCQPSIAALSEILDQTLQAVGDEAMEAYQVFMDMDGPH